MQIHGNDQAAAARGILFRVTCAERRLVESDEGDTHEVEVPPDLTTCFVDGVRGYGVLRDGSYIVTAIEVE